MDIAPAPTPKYSSTDAANHEAADQLAAQSSTWRTQAANQEAGVDKPLNMTCSSNSMSMVSQPIGPNGGVLRFGTSSLTIPQGALSSTVQISATVSLGQLMNVDSDAALNPGGVRVAMPDLPRTRNGRVSELAARDAVHGRAVKNTGALADPEALAHLGDQPELQVG